MAANTLKLAQVEEPRGPEEWPPPKVRVAVIVGDSRRIDEWTTWPADPVAASSSRKREAFVRADHGSADTRGGAAGRRPRKDACECAWGIG